jgi:hypothetical protein
MIKKTRKKGIRKSNKLVCPGAPEGPIKKITITSPLSRRRAEGNDYIT